MPEANDEIQASKIEFVFLVGIVGCMLFATWELGHLMADDWFSPWVNQDRFTNARIVYYGIAFLMAIPAIIITAWFSPQFGRFGATINRAFLWYGTLLLISTIAIFVFDCLPEVIAGFTGAGIFITAIYVLQKRFFTKDRVSRIRLGKGRCPRCGATLRAEGLFCPSCGREVGRKCPKCQGFTQVMDKHCAQCGGDLA